MELNKYQKKAVSHINGPALVLAVPGAGKTTVLIHRTNNLIENHNINPDSIISITFSRASANDMKKRYNTTFPNFQSTAIKFSTIHSFSYTILREYAYRKNIKYTLLEGKNTPINKNALLRKIYFEINGEYITEERLEGIVNTIGYIKNMCFDIDEYMLNNNVEINNFKEIYMYYENYKLQNHLIDFDDMLVLTYKILKEDKYLLNKYRNKYNYIQVDEGQDTSKIQMEIIKTIAYPNNNLFIVADDDQSIYGFRGAFPKGLLEFKKIYPQAKIFYMEENFRSSKNIVNVSNKFIKQNTLRYDKNLFTKNKDARPIQIVKAKTVLDQYEYLVGELKKYDELSNTAILYRNNISTLGLIEYLEKNNIPFHLKDMKISLFNHWMINDIVAFLTLAKDDTNISAFEKIYYKMRGFVYKKYINYIKTLNFNASVFDRILLYPGLDEEYKQKIIELKRDFKYLSRLKPCEAISFIEEDLKYERYLRENSLKLGYTYDSLKTILFDLKLIAKNTPSIEVFLSRLKYLDYLSKKSVQAKNGVVLSTIHAAKGLEFKNVYMIDLVDGDFPTSNSIEAFYKGNYDLLEEERRLFYVGMTRAKEVLDLVTIKNRNDKKVESSKFLVEIEDMFKK
ncbi:ATP-dependent helicase [Sporanaerobacter acetigenes]|uniref:ATP-dependent helicase n=1 Tax=Sporanaerobacter acetigenes TaxID=165813 RepID=UPI001046CA77|nr:ATP-dependent helicase [Sporanaerobacter acetigenes]